MEEQVDHIINYLNHATTSKYMLTNLVTRRYIKARLKDGFSIEDFEAVIDSKTKEWKYTEMEKYLRPQTLFSGKFESYLQASTKGGPESKFQKANREMNESKDKIKSIFNDGHS